MTPELRKDLMVIILEEAFGMREPYARKLVSGHQSPDRRFRQADVDALDAVDNILSRIDSRCSRIEG